MYFALWIFFPTFLWERLTDNEPPYCDQIVTKTMLCYSVLLGNIDLQSQRWGVSYPRPAYNLLNCNDLYKWR